MSKRYRKNEMNRAPAGWSWTTGTNPWGNPPKFTRVQDAVDYMINRFDTPAAQEGLASYVAAGVPVSTLGRLIARTGFSQNLYNPDVAELMQTAINTYITSVSLDKIGNAPIRLTPERPNQQMAKQARTERQLRLLMEEQQPQMARLMYESQDEMEQQQAEQMRQQQAVRTERQKPQGFATKREETA
tara:strand:- start:5466 stop:6026 length:561 start_codon:yes stop_codon:yes gene_type:complete